MIYFKKYLKLFFVLAIITSLTIGGNILAQETPDEESVDEEMIVLDESVSAQDLGISEPKLLPDSPFYFLKEWGRGLRSFFTFNPVKKAELQMKFASEKLLEAKKLAEKGKIEKAEEVLEKHNLDLEKVKKIIKKKEKDPRIKNLREKMARRIIRHQKILDRLEGKVPLKDLSALREIKEKAIKIYLESEDPKEIKDRLEKILNEEKGSDFKELKSLQVLMRVRDLVPEEAQPAIERAIENQSKRFKEKFEKLPPERQALIERYLSRIGGDRTRALEALREIEGLEISPEAREKIEKAKERLLEKLKERIEKAEKENAPEYTERLLRRLERGDFRKLEILKKLEKDVPIKFLPKVLEARKKARERFLQRLEKLPQEKRNEFLERIADKADLDTLEILREDKDILPPEKRQRIEELEKKIKERIKNRLQEAAKDPHLLRKRIHRFLGANPGEMEIIENLPIPAELKEKMREGLKERLAKRLRIIRDPERLERIQEELKEKKIQLKPEVMEMIKKRLKVMEGKLTVEKVKEKINEAKRLLEKLEEKIEEHKEKLLSPEYKEIIVLKKLAQRQLEEAEALLAKEKIGEAWGKATSALVKIKNALKILERSILREKVRERRTEASQESSSENPDVCPASIKPNCPNGVLEETKDSQGCVRYTCKEKKESEEGTVCPALWDPVCGEDGKTYSNACKAKVANVKVAYKGACKKCAKEGERINKNPLLGPTSLKCCPGLTEVRISKSYSVCKSASTNVSESENSNLESNSESEDKNDSGDLNNNLSE